MVGGLATKSTGIVLDAARQVGGAMPGVVTLPDHSRFGNHGAMTNVTWIQIPPFGLWVMSFNGVSSFVNCGNDVSLDFRIAMTGEFWFRPYAFEAYFTRKVGVFYPEISATRSYTYLRIEGVVRDASFNFTFAVGEWHHYVFTYDGTTIRLFLDGIEPTYITQWAGGGILDVTANNLNLGWYGGGTYVDGDMALVRFHKYAVSPGQILQRFEATRRFFGV